MKKSEKYIKFLAYLVVVILVNIVGASLFFRIDLTANKMFSISEISKEAVSSLTEPMTIHVFFTDDLPAPHNTTKRHLQDLLKEYEIASNKKYFHYNFHDISAVAEESDASKKNKEMAESYGISPVQIRLIEQDEMKAQNVYMGLVIIHGDLIEKIPTMTDVDMIEYTLTTLMKKMNNKISVLNGLQQKINVDLIMSSSLKQMGPAMRLDDLPNIPEKVEGTVNKISQKSYGKISFKYNDPSMDNTVKEKFAKNNILTLKWNAMGEKISAGEGSIGLVVTYGSKSVDITVLNAVNIPIIGTHYELISMEGLENQINGAIESLVDINEKIGYLADHGTTSRIGGGNPMMGQQQSEMNSFNTLVSQNYSIKDVQLTTDGIPGDINSLIIANPTASFTDYELYQIDQALMSGKNLAFFLDSFMETQQPNNQFGLNQGPGFQPLDTGLEKLLSHYGLNIQKSYVMDENCFKQNMQNFGGGERSIYFAPLIQNENINSSLDFMKNIKGLVTMRISPVTVNEAVLSKAGVKASPLFSSSAKSWEMKDNINLNPMFLMPPREDVEKKSYTLAYYLEGTFSSYFDGKPVPEKQKPDETPGESKPAESSPAGIQKEGGFIAKSKPAKILVVSSAEMLKDSMIDPEGQSPNATFILNAIDAVNGNNGIAHMRSKKQSFNPLEQTGPMAKTALKVINIAGLPLLVILFGLFVWIKRKSRKKQIQMMFAK